ncbi:hypothetical protein [Thalassospira xiamenensis]|uniref:Uncharacterized protein n=1 Tax=Thalassospira xiamenensis TaxID=220697 RepID=A0A367X308_9PROT|nr:hypothetical protein [Thalassospira xiamenensis]KZB51396.1 hypothetical protein AUP41_06590 [Thalassospira xiamenensis]RCK48053.1 hypothetical protein TH44_16060 [Thalassospira xiamenensis]
MRRMTLEQLSDSIDRKKAELGYSGTDYVARNSGEYRTQSKRDLLLNIAEAAAARGEKPKFDANY